MINGESQSNERRPIASREAEVSKRAAHWLVDRGFTPNSISIVGMIAGISAGAALFATAMPDQPTRIWWVLGAVLVQLRLLCNMFDGMVAIESGKASAVGELYNEIPDRVSDAATLVGLGYALGSSVELGFLAACLAVFVAYVRAMGKASGGEQEFCGPMAKPQRMFIVTIVALYCGLAPADWPMAALALNSWSLPICALLIITFGSVVTAIRRLMRIALTLRRTANK